MKPLRAGNFTACVDASSVLVVIPSVYRAWFCHFSGLVLFLDRNFNTSVCMQLQGLFPQTLVWDKNLSYRRHQEAVAQVELACPWTCTLHLHSLMWELSICFLVLVFIMSPTYMANRNYVQAAVFVSMGSLMLSLTLPSYYISGNLKRLNTHPSVTFGWNCIVASKIICKMKKWRRGEHSNTTWLHMLHSLQKKRKKKRAKVNTQEAETPSPACWAVPQRNCSLKAGMDLATSPTPA